jgi:hypothetical protein
MLHADIYSPSSPTTRTRPFFCHMAARNWDKSSAKAPIAAPAEVVIE